MSNRNRIDLSPSRRDRRYLEFDLDAETMALVEEMAAEDQVTPFEMCVQLLRERALRDGETEPSDEADVEAPSSNIQRNAKFQAPIQTCKNRTVGNWFRLT